MWITPSDAMVILSEAEIETSRFAEMEKRVLDWRNPWQNRIWGSQFFRDFLSLVTFDRLLQVGT